LPCHLPWWRTPLAIVLAGGAVMGLALGVRHASGIFLLPIAQDHGWTRETLGFAFALQNLVWGLTQPFVGMVADRRGARPVVFVGLLLYAAGLAGMAWAATPFGFTLAAGLAVGTALSCTSFGVIYGALSRLMPLARRGWALGLAGAAGGLGQFFLVPVAQVLIDAIAWGGALVVMGALCLAALPCALPLVEGDEQGASSAHAHRQSLGAALREALGHRGFWLLNLGFFACGFQLAFIAGHLPSYLLDRGLPATAAATGLAVIALANVAGTYGCGLLGAAYRRKYLLAGVYLLRAAAMALFFALPLSEASLYAFCAVMGLLWLGTVPLTNGLVAQVFGVRYLTTLFGCVFLGHQLGSFLGMWLGGRVYEMTHSYDAVWIAGIGLGLVAALLHLPIDDREIARPGLAGAAA
jgi:MFS family permease